MRRFLLMAVLGFAVFALGASPVFACGGLIGPNGAVNLLRTSTLAAYHDGVEHYVTAFTFAGGEGEFGSIVPLPGVPTKVERGGDWTLQRLIRETQPQPERLSAAPTAGAAEDSARVILETKIDALDITVLEGGAAAVGTWALEHGFRLPPDAPEVLEFYASRSPYFMAARFDANRARERGQAVGDGTPVHITVPTDNPWVPLRILALGKGPSERIQADVYLLTDDEPTLLPNAVPARSLIRRLNPGLVLEESRRASRSLLADLRSDKGMEWMPSSGMWLTFLRVDAKAGNLTYDLAVDASGRGTPSTIAAGLESPIGEPTALTPWVIAAALAITATGALVAFAVSRSTS